MSDMLDMVDKLLTDLKNIGGVTACAAASRDGLLIRAIMQKEQFVESLVAMSATMLGAAETATTHVEMGVPSRIIVESDYGKLVIVGAGPKALLILLANQDSGLGLILLELDKSAKKLKEILT
jgi:predicted regulator of Ras-like GTPase activity (Roadblock/LC7/MglB family)